MKLCRNWLLALLSIMALVATSTFAIAEEAAHMSGSVELGVTRTDLDDNTARVNEYVKQKATQGPGVAGKLDLEFEGEGGVMDLSADFDGSSASDIEAGLDTRIFKLDMEYQEFDHWKDHDLLEHIGATMRGDIGGDQPRVTSDATLGQIGVDSPEVANARYELELANDYIITHSEWENEAEVRIPQLPNVTLHAGLRIEERDGLEQSRSLAKCNQCHVQANPKSVNEKTEDVTFGITGKFGLVTVDYEYLTRDFTDKSSITTYNYLRPGSIHAGVVDSTALLYGGEQEYGSTPDSEKDSHTLKARVDINRDTSVSASYVNAEVESNKAGDVSYTLDKSSLTSEFESFFLKGSTNIGGLRLSMRGGTYEIDGPEYTANFPDLIGFGTLDPALGYDTTTGDVHKESAESRDVTEFGIDGVYRIASGTTLRLGYEYEEIDRDEEELGNTETNTFKAAVKSRLNSNLSGRISYTYQNIDEPLAGALVGIGQVTGMTDSAYPGFAYYNKSAFVGDPGNTPGVYYWNSVYPNRELESSMSPEDVHEFKFASTWTPSVNMAATVSARVRMEENDDVNYKQDIFVPGASLYYAPNGKMNLTMAYTFNKMETENQMCVGWYHG